MIYLIRQSLSQSMTTTRDRWFPVPIQCSCRKYRRLRTDCKPGTVLVGDYKHRIRDPGGSRTQGPENILSSNLRLYRCRSLSPHWYTQGSKVKCKSPRDSLPLCVCKPGFAKLTVDYSEDQRSQRIALCAINNAFGVQTDHIQELCML